MKTKNELIDAMKILLDIPNIDIQDVFEDKDGNYIVTAISTIEGTECHEAHIGF